MTYPSITLESGLLGYAGIAPPIGPSPSVVSTARDPPGAHPPISDFEGANGPRKWSVLGDWIIFNHDDPY